MTSREYIKENNYLDAARRESFRWGMLVGIISAIVTAGFGMFISPIIFGG